MKVNKHRNKESKNKKTYMNTNTNKKTSNDKTRIGIKMRSLEQKQVSRT